MSKVDIDELVRWRDKCEALAASLQRKVQHCDEITEERDKALRERDEARALNAEWAQKAATWIASPEAAQRLDGYRDLGQQVAEAQRERDEARAEVGRLQDKAIKYDLDRAGIDSRAQDAVALVEARAELARLPAWQKGCEQALADLADAEEAIARLYTERDEARASVADAYRRGAEAMRLACQEWCRAWENNGEAIADALADLRVEDKP